MASVASWPARRLASASVAPGRVYSCRSRCACSHQRALSRISATSASLLRTIRLSMNGASGATRLLRHLAQRRTRIAEDPRIAVLVGAGGTGDPQVQRGRRARMRIGCSMPGYSGYDSTRSNSVSASTRSTSNSGTKTAISPVGVGGERDRPLGRQEAEAREVLDVVLAEEHVAGEVVAADVLQERLAPLPPALPPGCRSPAWRQRLRSARRAASRARARSPAALSAGGS